MKKKANKRRTRGNERSEEGSVRIGGLTLKQHAFLREKILGMSDKDAALAAGYALTVAKNTKHKIWSIPGMVDEFERLKAVCREAWRKFSLEEKSDGSVSAQTD